MSVTSTEIDAVARELCLMSKTTAVRSFHQRAVELVRLLGGVPIEEHHSNASHHPYGFLLIRVYTNPPYAVRLHMWLACPRYYQSPNWPVHSHPWDLRGVVLTGTLTQKTYRIIDDPQSSRALFRAFRAGQVSALLRVPTRVQAELTGVHELSTGEDYTIACPTYHEAIVSPDTFAATLVVSQKNPGATPYVVGEANSMPIRVFQRQTVDCDILRAALAELAKRIEVT